MISEKKFENKGTDVRTQIPKLALHVNVTVLCFCSTVLGMLKLNFGTAIVDLKNVCYVFD